MAFLSLAELTRIRGMRPDVQSILSKHMAQFEATTGKKTFVPADGGVRTNERQRELQAYEDDTVAKGGQPYAVGTPGRSAHEYGAGYDLQIVGGGTDADYETLGTIGESLGMRWGGRFKTRKDVYHFETPETLDVWRAKWAQLARGSLQLLAIAGIGAVIYFVLRHRRR